MPMPLSHYDKIRVSCAKYCLFYRALLQKRPIISPSHIHIWECVCRTTTQACSYVWHEGHDSICWTWLILVNMTHSICMMHYDEGMFICVTWLVHMCDMTRSYVWHDSIICVTWLVHMCHMTRSYVWHDSFICVTWLVHMCDMTRFLEHDAFNLD